VGTQRPTMSMIDGQDLEPRKTLMMIIIIIINCCHANKETYTSV
jgi:hypothetical protein